MYLLAAAIVLSLGSFVFFTRALTPTPTQEDIPVVPLSASEPARAEIIFGGDMMFDRFIRAITERKGDDFIFSCLDPLLQSAGLVVANLEGPITHNASVSLGTGPGDDGNFAFTFPTSTAALLARHHILAVSTGNNHIRNFGLEGAEETARYLQEAGIGFAGDPPHPAAIATMIGGVPLALISYNEFSGGRGSASTTLAKIETARAQGRMPIVFAHWGDEYLPVRDDVRALAHTFVDAGAEIVVGAHPHVVQENEMYGGKHIYYSLGNLIFDQYWNEAVRTGLLLHVVFGANGVEGVTEIPVELLRDGRTCPVL